MRKCENVFCNTGYMSNFRGEKEKDEDEEERTSSSRSWCVRSVTPTRSRQLQRVSTYGFHISHKLPYVCAYFLFFVPIKTRELRNIPFFNNTSLICFNRKHDSILLYCVKILNHLGRNLTNVFKYLLNVSRWKLVQLTNDYNCHRIIFVLFLSNGYLFLFSRCRILIKKKSN